MKIKREMRKGNASEGKESGGEGDEEEEKGGDEGG